MRVIAGPKEVVGAVHGCRERAGAIVLKSEENIVLEVFTGRQLVDVPVGVESALAAEPVVDLLHQVGDPTDVELGTNDFEFWVAV